MKNLRLFIPLLICFSSATALAQHENDITYNKKPAVPGTVRTLAGQDFVLVRLPIKEFAPGGNRYSIDLLVPILDPGPPISFFSSVSTIHSNEALQNPVSISGYPATVEVVDGREYTFNRVGFQDGLSASAYVLISVNIKLGDTLVTISQYFSKVQQSATPVDGFKSAGKAQWNKYVDPLGMIAAASKWLNFVVIRQL